MDLTLLQEQNLAALQIQALNFITLTPDELNDIIVKKCDENPLLELKYKSNIYESENISASAQEKSDNYNNFYESLGDNRKNLSDTLEEQLRLSNVNKIEKEIALLIIHSLDYNGFLTFDKDTLLEKIDAEDKDKIYYKMCDLISSFEPTGCACENTFESLKKQFTATYGLADSQNMLTYNLINEEDFESFAKGNVNHLSKKYKADRNDIISSFEQIKTLNPYPGSSYNIDYDNYSDVDVFISLDEDNNLVIMVEEERIPSIEINNELKCDKKMVSAYKSQINSLMSLLELRKSTLAKIASFVINYQSDYILGKTKTKKALGLKEIAENTDMSVSTISRIINLHYAQYENKIFSLRSLLEQKSIMNNSQDEVLGKIKEIISSYDEKLSDEKIKKILEEKYSISIARRTVQKYRSKLNISSSYKRENTKELET